MKILSKSDFNEKKSKFLQSLPYLRLIVFSLIIFGGLLGVRLYLTNLLATSGVRLTATTQRIEELEVKNSKLQNEISSFGSVSRISKEAKKLGFEPVGEVKILTSTEPLVQKP